MDEEKRMDELIPQITSSRPNTVFTSVGSLNLHPLAFGFNP